jgi:hypothetical protein
VGRAKTALASGMQNQLVSIDRETDWSVLLTDVDVVIHLAEVHVMMISWQIHWWCTVKPMLGEHTLAWLPIEC